MATQLDIVKLIEKNPITRLSQDYQNKLLNKIKTKFTEGQQQLFVSSFYCYLNHNSKNEFIIDLDDVWKWLGFSRKDPAKVVLDKNFIKDIDYKIVFQQRLENLKGGRPKEKVLMNINTFKKLCLKAGTKKADEIHDYYIGLEELLQETLNEETDELRRQITTKEHLIVEKDKIIELNETQNKLERHQLLIDKFNNKRCLYIAEIVENKYIKIGSTKDVDARIKNFRRDYKNQNIIFLDVFECQNFREVEESILQDEIIRTKLYKGNIAGRCSKEIVEISNNFTFQQLYNIVENYINANISLYTPDQILEKTKLEFEEKKIEYNLLNNIINNNKYSKTIENILKNTLPNIINKINFNILAQQNNNNFLDKDNKDNYKNQLSNDNVPIKIAYKMQKPMGKKILKIDATNLKNIIQIYDSMIYALRDIDNNGFSKSEIQQAIRSNRLYKGFRWVYVEKDVEPKDCVIAPTAKSLQRINEIILELNSDKTQILNSFATQTELFNHLNISKGRTRKIIINEILHNNKYYITLNKCPKELLNSYDKKINNKTNHNAKSIKQINLITKEAVIFKSLKEINMKFGFSHSTINNAINKKHIHGGFLWEYYDNKDNS